MEYPRPRDAVSESASLECFHRQVVRQRHINILPNVCDRFATCRCVYVDGQFVSASMSRKQVRLAFSYFYRLFDGWMGESRAALTFIFFTNCPRPERDTPLLLPRADCQIRQVKLGSDSSTGSQAALLRELQPAGGWSAVILSFAFASLLTAAGPPPFLA